MAAVEGSLAWIANIHIQPSQLYGCSLTYLMRIFVVYPSSRVEYNHMLHKLNVSGHQKLGIETISTTKLYYAQYTKKYGDMPINYVPCLIHTKHTEDITGNIKIIQSKLQNCYRFDIPDTKS